MPIKVLPTKPRQRWLTKLGYTYENPYPLVKPTEIIDKNWRTKTYPSLLEAMPQLMETDQLKRAYVAKWRKFAKERLKFGTVSIHKIKGQPYRLYSATRQGRGVFFISQDGKTIDYLYGYQVVSVKGKASAYEALAYRFNPDVKTVSLRVFFDHLLPELKFVVTDSLYTPEGYDWFRKQYSYAFDHPAKYQVYAIDTATNFSLKINQEEFQLLTSSLWGHSEPFAKYRYAIELK